MQNPNVVFGDDGANVLTGTSGSDLIYGFNPNGPESQVNSITATRVAAGLSQPVFATEPTGDMNHLYVAERTGAIKIVDLDTNTVEATPFLDISNLVTTFSEGGLLGLAFDPNFAQNGFFYVYYTDVNDNSQISRYHVASGSHVADPNSATPILTVPQDISLGGNHKAGWIGFGPDNDLYVALGDGGGFLNSAFVGNVTQFGSASLVFSGFGASPSAGGWTSENIYPRTVADVNGDGFNDLVGFGDDGVYVTLHNADGTFGATQLSTRDFGASVTGGSWTSQDKFPRELADVNGDGRADVVGFGDAGVYVAFGRVDGSFQVTSFALNSFGASTAAGGWSSNDHYPRILGDVNGDGLADIVGFGDGGVSVSLANGGGSFQSPMFTLASFGASAAAGGWASNDLSPRELADVNGDGKADIVGFGSAGVYISLATGAGSFAAPFLAINSFGSSAAAGGWSSNNAFPRLAADVTGDGFADLVGFGQTGVYIAPGHGDGTFGPAVLDVIAFGAGPDAGSWTSNDRYPRMLADLTGDHRLDIVGFGDAGVLVGPSHDFHLA